MVAMSMIPFRSEAAGRRITLEASWGRKQETLSEK
jgi:hypothetical protein